LPESHSCPALIKDKIDEKWFDEKFENINNNKIISQERNFNQSVDTQNSKQPSEPPGKKLDPDGNYTVADANPDKYDESGNYSSDDKTTELNKNSDHRENEMKPDGNYTVADANPDKYDKNGNYSSGPSLYTKLTFIFLTFVVIILIIYLIIL